MTTSMPMMGWTIHRTWAGPEATPNQLESNGVLLDDICHKDGAAQLQCSQPVEERMGGLVSGEEASVHDPGTEQFETAARWAPVLGDCGCRFSGVLRDLAAHGKLR